MEKFASCSVDKIENLFDSENIALAKKMALYIGMDIKFPSDITSKDFVCIVEKILSFHSFWNRKLMQAILEADELYGKKRPIDDAEEKLSNYIVSCPIKYLKENAERAYYGYLHGRY